MAKRKKALPALTPRGREVVTLVINSAALGLHDDDAEVGRLAKLIGMTEGRLTVLLTKLESQGWLKVQRGFVYPTVAALRWQNPKMSESSAANVLRALK